MSEIKYGLISKVDASVIERTLDLICADTKNSNIEITEIGLYSGETGSGMVEYVSTKGKVAYLIGVENFKDQQPLLRISRYNQILQGTSNEVYWKIPDNSQDLILVDACHCFAHVVSDFFCYAPKVKRGGYLAFHDTGKHIKPFKDFQHGDKENPDAYISVRKALKKIGLIGGWCIDWDVVSETGKSPDEIVYDLENGVEYGGCFRLTPRFKWWELIFDESDPNDEAGGVCVFKKMY